MAGTEQTLEARWDADQRIFPTVSLAGNVDPQESPQGGRIHVGHFTEINDREQSWIFPNHLLKLEQGIYGKRPNQAQDASAFNRAVRYIDTQFMHYRILTQRVCKLCL